MLDLPCGLRKPLVVELPVEVGDPRRSHRGGPFARFNANGPPVGSIAEGLPPSQSPVVARAGTRSFAGWPRCLLTRGWARAATDPYTEAWRVRRSPRWRRRGNGVAVAHDDEPE
jgi:hypothetical protein